MSESLLTLLQRSTLLQDCPETVLAGLAGQARIVQLPLGQTFQRAGQLPPGAALLLEGRLRRLFSKPGGTPTSLGFVEPGDWVSWSALWRGEPELTLSASRPSALLLVPSATAVAALQNQPDLRQALASPSFEELAALLIEAWQHQGLYLDDPLRRLQELLPACELLQPGDAVPEGHTLLYGGPRQERGPNPGTILDPSLPGWRAQAEAPVNGLPPRILVLPAGALGEPPAMEAPESSTASSLALRKPADLTATNLEPATPEAHGFGVDPATGVAFGSSAAASSRVEQALACILHLAAARRLSFSEELIRRNLTDVEQRLGALHLAQIGLQLEALGFETRPLRARPWDLARLEPPAMLDLDGAFVLLLAAGRGGGVLIGDPRHGLQRLSLQQLEQRFAEGLDVLLIREGPADPHQGEGFGISWFWPAFQRYPGLMGMTLFTGFVAQLLATVLPLGWMLVINVVVGQNNSSLLLPLSLILLVATVASSLLNGIRTVISADLSDRVDVRLGSNVVEHLLRLPLPYFESRQVGAILYNVNQLYNIRQFLVNQVLGVGLDLVFSVVFVAVLFLVSPQLTLLILLVVPILVVMNITATPLLQRQILESNRYAAAANSYLVEVLSGMRTVKSQNFEVEARWEWLNRYRRFTNSRFRLTQLSNLVSEGANLVNGLMEVAILVVAAILILNNQLSVGALFAVRILGGRMVAPLLRLSSLWQGFQEMKISLACIGEVMLAIPEVGADDRQSLPLPPLRGDLRFEQVSFRYGDRGPLLLDELDLHIEPGQMVGIVGLSGSGKSTLVQMIDRLYKPKSGQIYLDGYDIEKLQLASLRRRIGYVPQDSLLFEGTVLDNIRLNNPDADIEAVIEAASVAGAHDFILGLEKGYATRLGERGAGLSGGQRQRVCLARTVLQDPSFLILDEATSALDADMERQVCRNLSQRFQHCTVLFITHRLTTLVAADRILYMEKGRIIEDGSHHDLLRRGGAYATLYAQQVGGQRG